MFELIDQSKIMKSARLFSLSLLLLLGLPMQVSAGEAHEVVKNAADNVIQILEEEAESIKNNPDRVYGLVEAHILPHFDFERMSYFVLGNFWKKATPEQKKRFLSEFKHLLVSTYATALSEYSSEEEIVFMPTRVSSNPDVVVVPTEIRQTGSAPVGVAYRMYRNDDVWRIFDVAIGGISLVTNYRANFAGQIRKGGMDGLLESMARHNQPKAPEAH